MSSGELARIARQLLILASEERDDGPAAAKPIVEASDLADIAQLIYRNRRERDSLLDSDLFADPAWDMLLDLYYHHTRGKPVSVTDLCIASCVADTTALRWISILEARRLIERHPDPKDRRRSFLILTTHGYDLMTRYLRRTLRSFAFGLPAGRQLGET